MKRRCDHDDDDDERSDEDKCAVNPIKSCNAVVLCNVIFYATAISRQYSLLQFKISQLDFIAMFNMDSQSIIMVYIFEARP